MSERYIAVLDSGIGGISVLNEMIRLMPNERYLYLGDNKNAPYGNRTKTDLVMLTLRNIELITKYKLKALVIGCNTISTTILSHVSAYAGVPTFGVFPPIEKALVENRKILLLSTVRTANEYKNNKYISIIGLKALAQDIENNINDLSKVDLLKNLNSVDNVIYGKKFNLNERFETVILGCTHYFFIKNKIFDHFAPKNIISGNTFTAQKVYKFFKSQKSLEKYSRFELVFIGDCAYQNQEFFVKSGQNA